MSSLWIQRQRDQLSWKNSRKRLQNRPTVIYQTGKVSKHLSGNNRHQVSTRSICASPSSFYDFLCHLWVPTLLPWLTGSSKKNLTAQNWLHISVGWDVGRGRVKWSIVCFTLLLPLEIKSLANFSVHAVQKNPKKILKVTIIHFSRMLPFSLFCLCLKSCAYFSNDLLPL